MWSKKKEQCHTLSSKKKVRVIFIARITVKLDKQPLFLAELRLTGLLDPWILSVRHTDINQVCPSCGRRTTLVME